MLKNTSIHSASGIKGRAAILKRLTERQLRRRSNILSVARQLIAEKGYAGVTMRELAEKSGVAYKSLYDLYGSKDNLLGKAIEERLRLVFEAIDRSTTGKTGFDRLMDMIERSASAILEIPNLARALEPILFPNPGKFSIEEIWQKFHRQAIMDIQRQGDLLDSTDIDFILRDLILDSGSTRLYWANGVIPDEYLADAQKYSACKTLLPVLKGDSRERTQALLLELQQRLTTLRIS
ncbi:helix-turn-helix domain-containing protein [Iodidimonas sp. SYSU 1G8]|uniref:TetR/AcrR family transcriptional regulator n=1 Tax=Iodidimonas sp. SYSU 1G8 TaxID=3133967 RepID=UPI0031FE770D